MPARSCPLCIATSHIDFQGFDFKNTENSLILQDNKKVDTIEFWLKFHITLITWPWHDSAWPDMTWHDPAWPGMTQHDPSWPNMTQHDMIQIDPTWLYMTSQTLLLFWYIGNGFYITLFYKSWNRWHSVCSTAKVIEVRYPKTDQVKKRAS